MQVYLLSICDDAKFFCQAAAIFSGMLCFFWPLFWAATIKDEDYDVPFMAKLGFGIILISLSINIAGSVLIPERNALIQAYCMTGGYKVLTSENTEKAAQEFSYKLTKILNVVEDRKK